MKNYQNVLPLLALAFAMTFVEKTAAFRPAPCPENQVWSFDLCEMKNCSHIAHPPRTKCLKNDGGCICDVGYYWQDKGCVPVEKCIVTCPRNMYYDFCAPKPRTCIPPRSETTELEEKCRPRCVCERGYILAEEGSQECIPWEKCKLP
ncbi:IgGFc-binding protein-like [Mantella aurantiaca]